MRKNITKCIKLISVLVCLCIFVIQVFVGCSENYAPQNNSKKVSRSNEIKYISDNFDEYKSRIKDETEFEGKIVNEEEDGKEEKYIEFEVDNSTKIKFVTNLTVRITKQLEPSETFDYSREIEMVLFGMKEDGEVKIELNGNGSISCDYKTNDLEHPLPSQKEKDEGIDHQIKLNMSTQELEELSAKAHSIYKVFEEICNEYNDNLKTESK